MKESTVSPVLEGKDLSTLPLENMSEQSVLSKTTKLVKKHSRCGCKTDGSTKHQSGLIYNPLTDDPGMEKWIASLEDSHAKTYLMQVHGEVSKMVNEAVSSSRCSDLLAKYYPHSSSLKTSQVSINGDLIAYSADLPRKGMMVGGLIYGLLKSEPYNRGKGGFALPTIDSFSAMKVGLIGQEEQMGKNHHAAKIQNILFGFLTSDGQKALRGSRTSLDEPIYLNPSFAEKFMGFPVGWTVLEPLEMQSYLNKQEKHGRD